MPATVFTRKLCNESVRTFKSDQSPCHSRTPRAFWAAHNRAVAESPLYAAIIARCEVLGQPEHYLCDIDIDRVFVCRRPAAFKLLWHVNSTGTSAVYLDLTDGESEHYPNNHHMSYWQAIQANRNDGLWHYWDGQTLEAITPERARDLCEKAQRARLEAGRGDKRGAAYR